MRGQLAPWPKAVVFDLDGTLVDSAPDIAACINDVLRAEGFQTFSLDDVRGFIGNGIPKLVERAFAGRGRRLQDAELADKVAIFTRIYLPRVAETTRPYPGAIECVAALRVRGTKTAICTNKAVPFTAALLQGLGIETLFDSVVGGSEALAAKPAPDMLNETMRQLGSNAADTVMLGDSETDIATARAAGTRFVGVTFGYSSRPMRDLMPDATIDRFDEALAAIAASAR